MAGENSKKSGEFGEKLANALLNKIGWKDNIHNVSIACNTPSHINEKGKQRTSHGEDMICLYHNPFHDDRTDFVHVSVKNSKKGYPNETTLKTLFKSHLQELSQTIECAKHDETVRQTGFLYGAKNLVSHSGLLIWLHNDEKNIETSIIKSLSTSRLEMNCDTPLICPRFDGHLLT